jgi:hypothetical protein
MNDSDPPPTPERSEPELRTISFHRLTFPPKIGERKDNWYLSIEDEVTNKLANNIFFRMIRRIKGTSDEKCGNRGNNIWSKNSKGFSRGTIESISI